MGASIILIVAISLIRGESFFKSLFENIIGIANGSASIDEGNSLGYRLSLYSNSMKVIGGDYVFGRGLHVNTFFIMQSPYYGLFSSTSFDNGFVYIFLMHGFVGVFGWLLFCFSILFLCILTYKKRFNDHINFVIIIILLICMTNMLSVARLDESRSFMVIIGCFLGLDFNEVLSVNDSQRYYEIAI